jgi:hypothetical protein
MLGSIVVGGLQIRYGFRLYQDGFGGKTEKTYLNFGKFKLQTSSAGAAVMGLAATWGISATMLRPQLAKQGQDYKIYSLNDEIRVRSQALTYAGTAVQASSISSVSPETLLEVFASAAKSSDAARSVTINGKRAILDAGKARWAKADSGEYVVLAPLACDLDGSPSKSSCVPGSETKTVSVAFSPTNRAGAVSFDPTGVAVTGNGAHAGSEIQVSGSSNSVIIGKDQSHVTIGDAGAR